MSASFTRRRALVAATLAMGLAPLRAAASSGKSWTVGYLSGGSDGAGLAKELAPLGYSRERNLAIVARVARNREELAARAQELVALRPDALVAFTSHRVSALAERTRTIPIVSGGVSDPIALGLARSLRAPGGNVTGLSFGMVEQAGLQVGLLRTLVPGLRRLALLHSGGMRAEEGSRAMAAEAKAHGIAWSREAIDRVEDVEPVLSRLNADALVHYIVDNQDVARAALKSAQRRKLPVMGSGEDLVHEGALISVRLEHVEPLRRVATILDKVLRGQDPGSIPFESPDQTRLAINRATARALGVTIPPEVMLRATEVID